MAKKSAIERAVEDAGGTRALARKLDVWPHAVHKWLKAKRVPADRVIQLERETLIPREEWRPDLYRESSKTTADRR